MADEREQKRWMTRYLFGQLSEQERSEFEDSYLNDPELFEELASVEDELVRSYLRGECSPQEKAELEKRIAASPDWREKVEFERSLMEHVSSMPFATPVAGAQAPALVSRDKASRDKASSDKASSDKAERMRALSSRQSPAAREVVLPSRPPLVPALRFAVVAVGLVVMALGAWIVTINARLRQELAQIRIQQADLQRHEQQLQQQLAALTIKPPAMAPFVLTSHLLRDNSAEKPLAIPPGVSSVPLQLRLDQDSFPSYSIVLETAAGTQVWQQADLKSQLAQNNQHVIALELPYNLLFRGTYILKLTGISPNRKPEEVAVYIFRVARS